MNKKRKNKEEIILISQERIELFNYETNEWEKITSIPYIPLIINTDVNEINGEIRSELRFAFPYLNEQIQPYEVETYIINSERQIRYERTQNENYENTSYKIRFNNDGIRTLKKLKNNEYTLQYIAKNRNHLFALANKLQNNKIKTR